MRIVPDASGWRAIASIAEAPIFPIPIPAPITAMLAPRAANACGRFVICSSVANSGDIVFFVFSDL
jgi:hypothetical protein